MTTILETRDSVTILKLKYCSIIIDYSDVDVEIRVWPEDEYADEPAGVMNIPLSKLKNEKELQ